MGKRIIKDGKAYRYRRGKLVEIPKEWVGVVTSRQTIKNRHSKQTKAVRDSERRKFPHKNTMKPYLGTDRREPIDDE